MTRVCCFISFIVGYPSVKWTFFIDSLLFAITPKEHWVFYHILIYAETTMRLKFFVLKTFIQVRFVQKIITFIPLMLWVANRLQTTNIKISSRLVLKLKMHLSSHSLISCAKNSPVKPWLLWPRQNYWKVMHATKPFHPPHISIEQCIRSFYYFGAFVSTPSPFSTEFLGDVIWTPAFPPAPRDLKPIDLAAK